MAGSTLPIVILAGSDRRAAVLPHDGNDRHPLSGNKAVDVRIGETTLVETVIERLEASGRFRPIYVVGPREAFGAVLSRASLIDADGTLGQNIRTSLEALRKEHPRTPIGFITCDVLPDVDTLHTVLADYDRQAPCDLWFPLICAPEDPGKLGASSWKPAYRIVPEKGEPAVGVLPGHLAIVDPEALRREFLYRLIQLGYRTRNRPIDYRRGVMVRGVVLELIYQDLLHLVTLRAPTLTWNVLSRGLAAARRLRDGTITHERLERSVREIFMTSKHRRRYPERGARLPILEGLSLALDIDTEEEARAAGGDIAGVNERAG